MRKRFLFLCVPARALLVAVLLAAGGATDAHAGKRTVCTITVNSPDEKEVFRQRLPEGEYEFVELVERGRPDWLASACRQGVKCDVLVISGHFDSQTEFYSDRLAVRESLAVSEMERASCSDSCPGVFSHLKEVYLFGCNTMNGQSIASTTPEAERSLIRAGHTRAQAQELARALDQRHGESSRERMRRIFTNVPAIYGFTGQAPLGPTAAVHLNRYFESASPGEFGSGRANARLLGYFGASSMVVAGGLTDLDPRLEYQRDVCHFVDERRSPAEKIAFVRDLLRRDMAEVRMFLERIEQAFASLTPIERLAPSYLQAWDEIARDEPVRGRFLRFAEDSDLPRTRVRMIELAGSLGWFSPAQQRAELVRMVGDLIARGTIGPSDVDLICSLNDAGKLDKERHLLNPSPALAGKANNAAALACLGGAEARARMLEALTSQDDEAVEIAQVYFGHHPMTDVDELRQAASGIARMRRSGSQVRVLDTLARHRLSDRQSLDELARLFPATGSVEVQRAIAAVLIRADYQSIHKAEVAQMLSQSRLRSPGGADIIDVLIRRLRAT